MLKKRLKEQRAIKGLSQRALAEILNVSQQTIGSWETGRTEPDQQTLKKIANFFNVSVDYLLEQEDINNPSLSRKEKADIAKDLDEIKQQLLDSDQLMFDGMPMDEESITQILSALEVGMEMVRKKNKEKYTPKKYKR